MYNRIRKPLKELLNRIGLQVERVRYYPIAVQADKPPLDDVIVDNIFEFYDLIPPFYDQDVPSQLQIGGAWRQRFLDIRKKQLQYIIERNKRRYSELLENLFFDELLSGLWNYHYYNEQKNVHRFLLRDIKSFEQFTGQNKAILSRNDSWRRWGLPVDDGVIIYTDSYHGIQAKRLQLLLDGIRKNNVTVLDLGSGFGGMVDYLCRWSNRPLNIILVDIPLNLTTAYGYLARLYGEDRVKLLGKKKVLSEIFPVSELKDTQFSLIPTTFIEDLVSIQEVDILHNAASFSEMDYATVEYYIEHLVSPNVQYVVETNSNLLGSQNYNDYKEVLSRDYEVLITESHDLICRFPESFNTRYVTSIYKIRNRRV